MDFHCCQPLFPKSPRCWWVSLNLLRSNKDYFLLAPLGIVLFPVEGCLASLSESIAVISDSRLSSLLYELCCRCWLLFCLLIMSPGDLSWRPSCCWYLRLRL